MNDLIENIDKLHTTEMGVERIKNSKIINWTFFRLVCGEIVLYDEKER